MKERYYSKSYFLLTSSEGNPLLSCCEGSVFSCLPLFILDWVPCELGFSVMVRVTCVLALVSISKELSFSTADASPFSPDGLCWN